jgi:hypothetical protein
MIVKTVKIFACSGSNERRDCIAYAYPDGTSGKPVWIDPYGGEFSEVAQGTLTTLARLGDMARTTIDGRELANVRTVVEFQ